MVTRKFCDLDNTIIFSHRRKLIGEKTVVEYLNGIEQSFMLTDTYIELQKQGRSAFIPLTSRTLEQYSRISFFDDRCAPEYALIDNGGILLIDGVVDNVWLNKTLSIISDKHKEMMRLADDIKRFGSVKLQDDMILFLKPETDNVMDKIGYIGDDFIKFDHGNKIYICPSELEKGNAIRRFVSEFGADLVISAGDSRVDISMADPSDLCILARDLKEYVSDRSKIKFTDNEKIGMTLLKSKSLTAKE